MSRELFEARMKTIDPGYGRQQHQRRWLAFLDELQRIQPCHRVHPLDETHNVGSSKMPKVVPTYGEHFMSGEDQCYSNESTGCGPSRDKGRQVIDDSRVVEFRRVVVEERAA